MTRLAVIADVHGNADALQAVMADIAAQSPDQVVNLGDCLSGPLEAGRTADLLIEAGWPTVRGNHDRWLVTPPDPIGPWEADILPTLAPAQRDWLAALPPTLTVGDAFLCHATPASDLVYWLHHVKADGTVAPRPRDQIAAEVGAVSQPLILCGHTHLARAVQLPDGPLIVNPGSVGCPGYDDDHPVPHKVEAGTPRACYAILDRIGADWSVSFRQIPYDTSRVVRIARERGSREWASALGSGWL